MQQDKKTSEQTTNFIRKKLSYFIDQFINIRESKIKSFFMRYQEKEGIVRQFRQNVKDKANKIKQFFQYGGSIGVKSIQICKTESEREKKTLSNINKQEALRSKKELFKLDLNYKEIQNLDFSKCHNIASNNYNINLIDSLDIEDTENNQRKLKTTKISKNKENLQLQNLELSPGMSNSGIKRKTSMYAINDNNNFTSILYKKRRKINFAEQSNEIIEEENSFINRSKINSSIGRRGENSPVARHGGAEQASSTLTRSIDNNISNMISKENYDNFIKKLMKNESNVINVIENGTGNRGIISGSGSSRSEKNNMNVNVNVINKNLCLNYMQTASRRPRKMLNYFKS